MFRKKFFSSKDLAEAAQEIERSTKRVKSALVGGFAMYLYGSDRLTGDIDFVAVTQPFRDRVRGPLSFGGVQLNALNGVPVDWIVRADDHKKLYAASVDNAEVIPDEESNSDFLVVVPEYLVAMKMAAGRPKDETDLHYLLGMETLDFTEARKVVHKYLGIYAVNVLAQERGIAQWKKERE